MLFFVCLFFGGYFLDIYAVEDKHCDSFKKWRVENIK